MSPSLSAALGVCALVFGAILILVGALGTFFLLLEALRFVVQWPARRRARRAQIARQQKALADAHQLQERARLQASDYQRLRRLVGDEPYLLELCNLRPVSRVLSPRRTNR